MAGRPPLKDSEVRVDIPEYGVFVDFPSGTPPEKIQEVLTGYFPPVKDITNPDGSFKIDVNSLPVKPIMPEKPPLEPMVAHGHQMEMLQYGNPPEPQGLTGKVKDIGKGFATGVLSTAEGMAGGAQWLGGKTFIGRGAGKVADAVDEMEKKIHPERPGFLTDLASGFGSMATFLVPSVGVSKPLQWVGKIGPAVASWLGATTMATTEALTEAGSIYRESLKKSGNKEQAERAARFTFWRNMPLLLVTNKLGLFAERGGFLRKTLTSGLMEGTQEAGQSLIGQKALEQPLSFPQAGYEGLIGGIVGGGTNVVLTALDKATVAKDMPPGIKEIYDTRVEEYINQGLDEEKANINATADIAKTSEGAAYLDLVADAMDSVLKAEAILEKGESEYAEGIRGDEGQIPETGLAEEISGEKGRYNLQQQAPEQPGREEIPQKISDAVGKPTEPDVLRKMGITDEQEQIQQIVNDAVQSPLRNAMTAFDDVEMKQYITEAEENAKKLMEADGIDTERAIKKAFEDFKSAKKLPEGGAVAMEAQNLDATASEIIGHRLSMNPEAIYTWGQKHGIPVKGIFAELAEGRLDIDEFTEAVVNDRPPTAMLNFMGLQQTYEEAADLVDKGLKASGFKVDPAVNETIIEDLNAVNKYINTPKYLSEQHPEFKPIFHNAYNIYQERDRIISELYSLEKPYYLLKKDSRAKVDRAAEEGTLENETWTKEELIQKYGLDNKEIRAYYSLRDKYNRAFDHIVDLYVELGGEEADIRGELGRLKGYIPLSRFGQWAVTIRKDGEVQSFETFESKRKARQYANKIAKEPGLNVTLDRLARLTEGGLFEGMDMGTLAMFMKIAEINPEISTPFLEQAKEFFKARGFKKHFIQRKKTPGYSRKWSRVHADYTVGLANYISRIRGVRGMKEALQGIDPREKPELYDYAQKYIGYMEKPGPEAQKLRGALFLYYLGANVKSAALNLTQTFTTTAPYLTQYANDRRVAYEISKAAKDIMAGVKVSETRPHVFFDHGSLGDELGNALVKAEGEGIVNEQLVYELMAQSRGARLTKQTNASARALAYLFGTAEVFNRRVAFISAYRIGKQLEAEGRLPSTVENASEFAQKAVEDTQFLYGRFNRPAIGRGRLGATFFTFKSFMLQYMELLSKLAKLNGEPTRIWKRGAFYKALGMLALLAGLKGLPFADDLRKLYEYISGDNLDVRARDFSEEMFGTPKWGEVLMSGVTRLGPLDMSGAISLGDIIPDNETIQLLGPAGGVLQRIYRAMPYINRAEYMRGIETVSPEALRGPLAGLRIWREGHRNRRGALIFSGEEGRWPKWMSVASKSLSFQPSDLSRAYERERAQAMIGGRRGKKKAEYIYRLAKSFVDNDIEEYQSILKELDEYNKGKDLEDMILVSEKQIRAQVEVMYLPEDLAGIGYTPVQERTEYQRLQKLFK